MKKEEFIEEIKKLTVVELAELVKAIEEEFGVSAVAAAAPVAGAGAAAAEEKSASCVVKNLFKNPHVHKAHCGFFINFCLAIY